VAAWLKSMKAGGPGRTRAVATRAQPLVAQVRKSKGGRPYGDRDEYPRVRFVCVNSRPTEVSLCKCA
jgi:hypothetical protein